MRSDPAQHAHGLSGAGNLALMQRGQCWHQGARPHATAVHIVILTLHTTVAPGPEALHWQLRAIARNCVSPAPRPARCPSYFQRQTSGARARAHAGDDRRCLQLSRFHADSTPSPIIVLDMPMHINNIDNTISIYQYYISLSIIYFNNMIDMPYYRSHMFDIFQYYR